MITLLVLQYRMPAGTNERSGIWQRKEAAAER